jgi:hypothetical protein
MLVSNLVDLFAMAIGSTYERFMLSADDVSVIKFFVSLILKQECLPLAGFSAQSYKVRLGLTSQWRGGVKL